MYANGMRRARDLCANAIARNPAAPLAATGVVISLGLVLELSRRLNHDVGWLLVATNRLLEGAALYRDDVIEINPPLILYLFAPAVGLARLLALPEIATTRVWVGLVAVASLVGCGRALARSFDARDRQLARVLVLALGFVFFVLVGVHFGQREHFMLILIVPYLLSVAARAGGTQIPRGDALWIGVCAGLGFALKPHHLLVLATLEGALALRRRSLSGLLRPELVALVATGLLYLASVVVLTPAYLEVVLPLGLDTYWAYQWPLGVLLDVRELLLLVLAGVSLLALRSDAKLRTLGAVLFGTGVACYAAYLIQGTGYRYQRYPVNGMAFLLASLAGGSLVRKALREPGSSSRLPQALGGFVSGLLVLGLLLVPASIRDDLRGPDVWIAGGTPAHSAELVQLIDARAPGGSVYLLSIRLRAAFPAMNYSQARWASRFSHPWLLPAVIRAERGDPRVPSRLTSLRVKELERYQIEAIVRDLERHMPELIIVDRRPRDRAGGKVGNLLARFRQHRDFEAVWSHYRFVKRVGPFDVSERIQ